MSLGLENGVDGEVLGDVCGDDGWWNWMDTHSGVHGVVRRAWAWEG